MPKETSPDEHGTNDTNSFNGRRISACSRNGLRANAGNRRQPQGVATEVSRGVHDSGSAIQHVATIVAAGNGRHEPTASGVDRMRGNRQERVAGWHENE